MICVDLVYRTVSYEGEDKKHSTEIAEALFVRIMGWTE